ncbi:MAG: hypothetical protein EBT09_01760 [Actinobacteria bacterium]|nr:hypothetical protein [Actinomycetota bacterium]
MQVVGGTLVHTASDLVRYLECPHLAILTRDVALGRLLRPERDDPLAVRLQQRGGAVERDYLERLRASGRTVVEVPRPGNEIDALAEAARQTRDFLTSGVDAVAQAVLFDGTWLGYADVLERVGPQAEGSGVIASPHTYEVVDTKLAGVVQATAVVQLAQYTLQLNDATGTVPRAFHVVLGDGRRETIVTAHALAFTRRLRRDYLATMESAPPTGTSTERPGSAGFRASSQYPWKIPHCRHCAWQTRCEEVREHDDHLTLIPGMRRDLGARLATTPYDRRRPVALATPDQIAQLSATIRVPAPTIGRLVEGAGLSVDRAERGIDRALVVRRPPVRPFRGVWRVPPASPHDVFLHLEEDPYSDGIRLVFAGAALTRGRDAPHAQVEIATDLYAERDLATIVYTAIAQSRARSKADREHPPMHVFLFGGSTDRALRRLSNAHGLMELELDEWLRAGLVIDLGQVIREGILTASPVYQIADLDGYVGYQHQGDASAPDPASGEPALITFERWLGGDRSARDLLRDQVRSVLARMLKLHARLLEWQAELGAITGFPETIEPEVPVDPGIVDALLQARARVESLDAVATRLAEAEPSQVPVTRTGGQGDPATRSHGSGTAAPGVQGSDAPIEGGPRDPEREATAVRLLGHLLSWHRRESRTQWWEYFGHRRMDGFDHLEDTQVLGGLVPTGLVEVNRGQEKRGFTFPVGQEHKFSDGSDAEVTNWTAPSGVTVISIDNDAGLVILSARTPIWAIQPPAEAIAPKGPINDDAMHQALVRIADSIIAGEPPRAEPGRTGSAGGLGGPGPYLASRHLLLGTPARIPGEHPGKSLVRPGERASDAATRIVTTMAPGVIAIQGPPGTGKTYTAARMVVALLRQGKRVGVTSNSHKAIGNLLLAIAEAAAERNEPDLVRGIQKATPAQASGAPGVVATTSNSVIEARLIEDDPSSTNLFAGTAWLFSRPAFDGSLDAVFIDEAGQMSLANAVAIAACASRVVLLGDPQQLAQPSVGDHPAGAGASALGHLIGGVETMPPERGIFLDTTYRMHTDICQYVSDQFYEGRLRAVDACASQRVEGTGRPGTLEGSGLRFLPVVHQGNRTQSIPEADAIARACTRLIGSSWVSGDVSRPLTAEDIMVVAPYNRQVDLLATVVPRGVRVGTVDRFQGQEAPVVFYSLTASEATGASHGLEFLLSLNRLNVALSRARGLAVLACSPSLLGTACHSQKEIRQVNALCSFVEQATLAAM